MPSVNVKGVRLNYVEQGTGDKIIVFVHGLASAAGTWKEALELLPASYHAYALDLRGFGKSERAKEGFAIPQFAEDVYHFSQALGLERFTYVGHSMGGAIGMQLALDHTEVLKGSVLVAPVPADGFKVSPDIEAVVLGLADATPEEVKGLTPFFFTKPLSDQRIQELTEDLLAVVREAFFASMDAIKSFNVESRLGEIMLPTLIMAAEKDLFCPVDDLRRTAKGIGGSRFEISEGVGHFLHIENPKRFVDLLTRFIEDIGRQ